MSAGNGQVIHGSFPNLSTDRFRRSLIAHYIVGEAQQVAEFYQPILNFDGEEIQIGASATGGPCGIWTNVPDNPEIEIVDMPHDS